MGKLIIFSAVLGLLAVSPAAAQGSAKQRAACEKDSHRLCAADEPDAIAVEKCLKANKASLSKACRSQLQGRAR